MSKAKNVCRTPRPIKVSVIILAGVTVAVLVTYIAFGQTTDKHSSTIRMAAILFRHGEKNPTSFYPNDPHKDREWPGGLGALTMKGSLQVYNLGMNLRQHYMSLLPQSGFYTQQDMFVLSSYAERCIMSAQALLAGLMPVTKENSILPIPWQPVPVTTLPRLQDTLIAQKKPCASYDTALREIYVNPPPDLDQLNTENNELYQNLTKFTGKYIGTVLGVEFLYNTLKAEEERGLMLPAWTEDIYPDRLLALAERSYTVFTDNELMKRVKGGAFLGEVHKNMVDKANNSLQPNRKLFLYSAHDVTLVNVMNSMGILEQTSRLPDYASALVFELHEDPLFPESYEVRIVYYADSTVELPVSIDIPKCPAPCALETFTTSISDLLFEDYDEICMNPTKNC